ncbi:A-agglutinin anchorage subunit isoform X2 [Nasonia vitripennis]|uniref:Uncharacterized protein n=2 Tax=Nasonia vitripennis TaxID=7425 RepID=A0A7M7QJZ2_NASVI|nr:A-agglutinin anchorage subunit isoform X2 [Nasonia vitripennis]
MRRAAAGHRGRVFLGTAVLALLVWQAEASDADVRLTHDGPAVLGSTITFKAELVDSDGRAPSGSFQYTWRDNAVEQHYYETETTSNTTVYYSVSYPASKYHVGEYTMEVAVCKWGWLSIHCGDYTSRRVYFRVSPLMNGNITIEQSNQTVSTEFVASSEVAKISVNLRKGDLDYITKAATSITTYWFVDCKAYNQTNDFTFVHNFTNPKSFHTIEALVVASFEPPTTTTVAPTTTSTTPSPVPTTPKPSNNTDTNSTTTTTTTTTTTPTPTTTPTLPTTTIAPRNSTVLSNATVPLLANATFPYICNSILDPKPNTTYGYFQREVKIRAPISKLSIEGSTWIQPWNSLSLSISCNGTGPFYKCIEIHLGKYNVTGNETCSQDSDKLETCKFNFEHYFLEPLEYTVLIILGNEVSKEIHPVAVNIYKLMPKPQLSVIVVPVSCSLVAIVLIIFGIAYYVQNRSRFTVEVADFDFGQSTADMEYKTFTERLRDSFNNAVRPGSQHERLLGANSLGLQTTE